MKRHTLTEKWEDPWFSELTVEAKLLFLYFTDKVDNAGFNQVSPKHVCFATGLTIDQYKEAMKELLEPAETGVKVILHNGYVFLTTFLKAQSNLPLKSNNNCHRSIARIEESHYRNIFFDCDTYSRPERVEVNGKTWENDIAPAKPRKEVEEKPQEAEVSENTPRVASRMDLRTAKRDWVQVKAACISKMSFEFRSQPLYDLMGEWWDHMYELGNPYEVSQWARFCSNVKPYGPEVIERAIRYAITNQKSGLSLDMAKKLHHEAPVEPKPKKPAVQPPADLRIWKQAFKQEFPNAPLVPNRPADLPEAKQKQVAERVKKLTAVPA